MKSFRNILLSVNLIVTTFAVVWIASVSARACWSPLRIAWYRKSGKYSDRAETIMASVKSRWNWKKRIFHTDRGNELGIFMKGGDPLYFSLGGGAKLLAIDIWRCKIKISKQPRRKNLGCF